MRQILRLIAIIAAISTTSAAVAQNDARTERVQFAAGTSGATIRDSITGYEVVRYLLGAQAGQLMNVTLNTANTSTYFNILQPSQPQGPAMAQGELQPQINRFEGPLPESGDYVIEVFMYRAAARRGDVADFTLDVSISSGGSASSGSATGGATANVQGNPEFWLVNVQTSLNVHGTPSTSSPTFFQLPNGSIVRNLGCEAHEGRTWCMVPTGPNDGSSIGWVAAEFLVPGTPPPPGTNAFIPTDGGTAGGDTIANTCRRTAIREFGRDDLVDLRVETARVDGVVPVNGQFSDGSRFQCEFSARGELLNFRATN